MQIDDIIRGMSLREKVAQLIFPAFFFDAPDYQSIEDLVKLGVGGICIYRGSIFEVPGVLNAWQNNARIPLAIACDFEDGAGDQVLGATVFPSNLAVTAAGKPQYAREKGRVTGIEARAMGVHIVYGPVCDVNINPNNPIIATRSFGDNPETVAGFAGEFIAGCHESNLLTCTKHFPGHGDVTVDPHLALPSLHVGADRLNSVELYPFRKTMDATDMVMTAHLFAPAIDSEKPSTISPKLNTELLRKELRFGGIITTDALIMGGITSWKSCSDPALDSIKAGADVALFPDNPWRSIDLLAAAVTAGEIPEDSINLSVKRILQAKERAGLLEERITDPRKIESIVGNASHEQSAQKIADESITVFDEGKLLPLSGKCAYRRLTHESVAVREDVFERELSDRLDGSIDESAIVVIGAFLKPTPYSGVCRFTESQAAEISALKNKGKKVVLCIFGNPYLVDQFSADAVVHAYCDAPVSQKATARALTGKLRAVGTMPVKLPR